MKERKAVVKQKLYEKKECSEILKDIGYEEANGHYVASVM